MYDRGLGVLLLSKRSASIDEDMLENGGTVPRGEEIFPVPPVNICFRFGPTPQCLIEPIRTSKGLFGTIGDTLDDGVVGEEIVAAIRGGVLGRSGASGKNGDVSGADTALSSSSRILASK